jgi:amino-acid N-acetyltransferase
LSDVEKMHQLLAHFARQQMVLPRSPGELFETLRDFHVATIRGDADEEVVVGCCALHLVNGELAEIKSLSVASAQHGHGLGRRLVETCCSEAHGLGLARVFCLTNQQQFFARLGFEIVDRARLPEKVWGECVRCDRFFACDEIAMWREVG